ncbi:MAG TPA: DoxX family protein [Rhizomicrobium sp.]|jgi:putative oxidoreductase
MSISERISPLIGRLALAWFFLSEAWARAHAWQPTVSMLRAAGVSAAEPLLVLALVVMVLGGVSLVLGFHARHGAVLLFGFTIAVTILLHAYWKVADEGARLADYEIFARNIAISGALLMIVGLGAGPFAVDSIGRKKS